MSIRKAVVCAVAVLGFAVSSSFASWDYYPPQEAGKGEAKLAFEFGIPQDKTTTMDLYIKGRYSIIEGLEASVILPIPLSYSYDGNSAEKYVGLSVPVIGVRYWLPMGLGFFADAFLPVDTRDGVEPDFDMDAGVQYSTNFTDEIGFGAELGLALPLIENEDFDMYVGAEVGYSLGAIGPYINFKLANLLVDADMTFDLGIGVGYSINDAMSFDVSAGFGIVGYKGLTGVEVMEVPGFDPIEIEKYGDVMPITIGASFSYKF